MLKLAYALEGRLASDTVRGREELRELFKDGLITLVPQPGGYYVARSAVLPLVLITKPPPEETRGGGFGTQSLVAPEGFEPPTFGLSGYEAQSAHSEQHRNDRESSPRIGPSVRRAP